jgi:hypothetical protein
MTENQPTKNMTNQTKATGESTASRTTTVVFKELEATKHALELSLQASKDDRAAGDMSLEPMRVGERRDLRDKINALRAEWDKLHFQGAQHAWLKRGRRAAELQKLEPLQLRQLIHQLEERLELCANALSSANGFADFFKIQRDIAIDACKRARVCHSDNAPISKVLDNAIAASQITDGGAQ